MLPPTFPVLTFTWQLLATDVFTYGVVVWTIYTQTEPYAGQAANDVIENMRNSPDARLIIPSHMGPPICVVLCVVLCVVPLAVPLVVQMIVWVVCIVRGWYRWWCRWRVVQMIVCFVWVVRARTCFLGGVCWVCGAACPWF